ncbi:MAG: hypothetical protein BWK76_13025 [Desulfobulbaceae bacterium A2]|nr:MAG: hypothetical protein BWK76_13025 [Desulfobulbaceae bacterium A2]
MKLFLSLFGLILIFEGLPYVAFPEAMRRWLRTLLELPPEQLRWFGLVFLVLGLGLCFLGQRVAGS